jgi:DNA-binding XRE family transcriptional regulator
MTEDKTNGLALKILRQRAGITQADAAKAIGTTTRTIYSYEQGASYPPDSRLVMMLSEYRSTLMELQKERRRILQSQVV